MPTYTYKCTKCENEQDEFHSMTEKPIINCSICAAVCEKQFSPSCNFVLKGSGFPSKEFKFKDQMLAKNKKMGEKMSDRKNSGEGVSKVSDL